jgi:GNAT superfamily N-acetyltransferase/RimJ/RimL family protein N-acetyltransferase
MGAPGMDGMSVDAAGTDGVSVGAVEIDGVGIERLDAERDVGWVRECFEIFSATRSANNPDAPRMGRTVFEGWLRSGWVGDPREAWVLPGAGGGVGGAGDMVDGFYLLELPSRENKHLGNLEIMVHPRRRRHGLGTALLRHAAGRALTNGRRLLTGRAQLDSGGEAFARSVGAIGGLTDIRRALDLTAVPDDRFPRLRATAERAAAGYSLISWTAPAPEEYLDQVAAISAAFADAPHNPNVQAPVWNAARVRDTERRMKLQQLRAYTMAARHDASGELAGLTQIEVSPEEPSWAFQGLTAVIRAHRGHRLGMLLKTAMLGLLAEAEPQLELIVTGNAETNEHMIAINEALGYRLLGHPARSWELPAADGAQV